MTKPMSKPRTIAFEKMHGAGNDFVLLDQCDLPSGFQLTREFIADLCHRRLGIGGDGLIVIGPGRTDATDFRMTYFNADGGEAEMCGNGARCSVAFAHAHGLVGDTCTFDTQAGVLQGTVHDPRDITVSLTGWSDLALMVAVAGSPWDLHCTCNTGVPHLIIPLVTEEDGGGKQGLDHVDVVKWGSTFRHHNAFAPAGTNVNWIAKDPLSDEFQLRTYERGVEDETLACGTGASAAAVVLCHLQQTTSPVAVRTRGGDLLQITVEQETGRLYLRGPAVVSFRGHLDLDELTSPRRTLS